MYLYCTQIVFIQTPCAPLRLHLGWEMIDGVFTQAKDETPRA